MLIIMRFSVVLCLAAAAILPAQVKFTPHKTNGAVDAVEVSIDDKPFTTFEYGEKVAKPYLAPVRSASGKIVTRGFPMQEIAGESRDHLHHTGLWFSYDDVNGTKLWENHPSYTKPHMGREVVKSTEYSGNTLKAVIEWRDTDGKLLLVENRDMTFGGDAKTRTIDFRINWETSMVFMMFPEWHRIPNAADDAERARLLRDPNWRAAARAQWDVTPSSMFPAQHPQRVRFIEVTKPELEPWLGRTLADLVEARGGHPSDVLADWLLENDLRPGVLVVGVANSNVDDVAALLVDPDTVIASSDAGAHVQMMCAAGDTTLLLERHVRDRGDLTLEQAVHELTGKLAGAFGFYDRGVVAQGKVADLTVFALDELHWDADVFVDDLPGGARRLRRPPGGYRYTLAQGEVTQEAGVPTDARPAGVLHSATG